MSKKMKMLWCVALIGVTLCGWTGAASAGVDKVRCILWQGDPAKFHTAISGQATQLAAVVTTTDTSAVYYKWVFGDGTESGVGTLSGTTKYNVSITHTYTGAAETPFTAKLLVDPVDNTMANAVEDTYLIKIQDYSLDARINIAIDKGLWWLYTNPNANASLHTFDNSDFMAWYQSSYGSYWASPTASAIQAFAINNHKYKGDPSQDPYVEAVRRGMNFLMKGYYYIASYPMLRTVVIGTQHGTDDPEDGQTLPNGYGIEVRDYNYRPIYEGGQVMDAIIASGVAPSDLTGRDFTKTDGTIVHNWTYAELLQDMADMYAWGQSDSGNYKGGWRYSWNDISDNSACQWAAIGMIPAQRALWNVKVPSWVKNYNINWLNYSHQSWMDGTVNYGGFGYTSSGNGYGTSPSGLVQMVFDGQVGYDDPSTPADERDVKWVRTERFFADKWAGFLSSGNTYGWYAFAKAMRLALPQPVERLVSSNLDWYKGSGGTKGLAERIVESQIASGYWNGNWTNPPLTTAWMIITLLPAPFDPSPTACFKADPNPTYADFDIIFDPSCSDHKAVDKDISNLMLFEWDWDHDGVYDSSTSDPALATHSFACASVPCSYPVTLKVTDDEGLTATTTVTVNITNPPHPPVASPGGPYMASLCAGDTLVLDGSASFDPNEGQHEAGCTTCPNDTITAWDWDFLGAPYAYSDGSGKTVTAVYPTAGVYNAGLRVSDNTALAYPGSGQPNLTDEGFTTVAVYNGCICNLAARAKSGKIQLTWHHTGAASYDIYRSTAGPNAGFGLIANDVVTTYATYLDSSVVNGTKYYYRVVTSDGCGSNVAAATAASRP